MQYSYKTHIVEVKGVQNISILLVIKINWLYLDTCRLDFICFSANDEHVRLVKGKNIFTGLLTMLSHTGIKQYCVHLDKIQFTFLIIP